MTPPETTPAPAGVAGFRRPLMIAGLLTLLAAMALVAVGVAVVAQVHGIFSVGVGAMLLLYGLMVGAIGVVAVRGRGWSSGAVVAAAVLHVLVVVAIARHANPWWWALLVPLVATAVAGVLARVRAQRLTD
ncbi:hypothetical protein ACSDQ9_02560 [Aestuariimicrobium soli]|uniref:hypothetical protein n=1 Tax=Aestuariimicrobium soli TaxID=2035834 RepID=UPI003EB7BCF4